MSSATFHHDKTVLPIAHYPEGRPNSVYSPSRPVQIASGSSLYVIRLLIADTLITNTPFSGLFAFASTSLILSLYNTNILQINKPNAVVGMALFCGGLGQFVAGIWEFPRGNAFGATGTCYTSVFLPIYLLANDDFPMWRYFQSTWSYPYFFQFNRIPLIKN